MMRQLRTGMKGWVRVEMTKTEAAAMTADLNELPKLREQLERKERQIRALKYRLATAA